MAGMLCVVSLIYGPVGFTYFGRGKTGLFFPIRPVMDQLLDGNEA